MFWLKTELWTADVVYTGFGTPMLKGAIAVQGGMVVGQGGLEELKARFPQAEVVHKGKALFPPPVNAHTHLDLSLHPLYQGPFSGFIPHVVAHREKRGLEAAQRGLEELLRLGVGAFADIVFRDEVMDFLLQESPLPGVVFYEVFAPDPQDAEEVFQRVRAKVEAWRKREGRIRVGLSPHAPYSVSGPLLQKLYRYARAHDLPLMIHAAESQEEVAFLRTGEGPMAGVYRRFSQTPWQAPGLTPIRYLQALGVLGPGTLLVHGVHLDEEEAKMLADAGAKVILCPRSNGNLQVGEAPLGLYARHGVELALGTDSRASSPDLDVKGEALFLWDQIDPRLLVRALTRGGYRALGLPTPRLARGTPLSLVHSL